MPGASSNRVDAALTSASPLTDIVIQLLGHKKAHPIPYMKLRRDIARLVDNQPDKVIRAALAQLILHKEVIDLGDEEYFLADNIAAAARRICEVLAAYHVTYPYERGMPSREIKQRFRKGKTLNVRRNIDPRVFDLALVHCRNNGLISENNESIRLKSYVPTAEQTAEIARLNQAVIDYVGQRRYHLIDLEQMSTDLGIPLRRTKWIVGHMLKANELISYGEGRLIERVVLDQIMETLVSEFSRTQRLTMQEIKQLLNIPRNAIIPLLENLDAAGFTSRDGDYRVLADGVS